MQADESVAADTVIVLHGPAGASEMGPAVEVARRDLSARQVGGILYVSLFGTIADWLEREAPRGPLVSELRRGADLVLDGSRRRNERVRPVARPAATRPG